MAVDVEREMQAGNPRWLRAIVSAWLPVVLWVAAIQGFASDGFSEEQTSRFIGPLLHWLLPSADPGFIYLVHFTIRKSAHAFEYAVLALLAWRAFGLSGLSSMRHAFRRHGLSFALVLVVATVDESRQAASQVRGGALADVALDLAGGLCSLTGLWWYQRRG